MSGHRNQSYRPFDSRKQPKKGPSLVERAIAKKAEVERAQISEQKPDEEATQPSDELQSS